MNLTKDTVKSFLDGFDDRMARKTENETEVQVALRGHPLFADNQRESAFVDQIVLECLSDYVKEYLAQSPIVNGKSASDLILAESSRAKKRHIACGTPAWSRGHPFDKATELSPNALYERWCGKDAKRRKSAFPAVCPDVALLAPFRVVFECKYFNQPATTPAKFQLASGLYQSFFYRGMPQKSPGTAGLKYGWDYEYACFLAYDATANRRLRTAWTHLGEDTRRRFWEDGNIYVIMLPQRV